jgi:type IV pilus assembly protein PilN
MSRDSDKGSNLVIGGPARANLLPPEVGAAAKGKIQRRNAVALIVVAVLIVIAGYVGASVFAGAAQGQLDAANQRTQELIAEQGKYVEVKQVTNLLDTATAARQVGMSTEIDWKAYLDDIQRSLPAGTLVTNVVAETATPLVDFAQPSVPLQGDRIGVLTFTATSASLPDVEQWLDALSRLYGYVDASPGSITLNKDTRRYEVTITMHINTDALLDRFDDEALAARDESRAKQDAANALKDAAAEENASNGSETPSPSPSPSSTDNTDGGQ